ncbi:hypothetical protein H4219_001256 [Mycoemilia scoparia]|uniref:Uncharacterized protein n=1 Tax=Mycoemilia scoparia TaxID=417184 RepID=A0A9W8A8Q3_9FUNG|nr:hypothetical protein H4219_001256 [Mycoemilia scoparia]
MFFKGLSASATTLLVLMSAPLAKGQQQPQSVPPLPMSVSSTTASSQQESSLYFAPGQVNGAAVPASQITPPPVPQGNVQGHGATHESANSLISDFNSAYSARLADAWWALQPKLQNAIDQVGEINKEAQAELKSMTSGVTTYNVTLISEFYQVVQDAVQTPNSAPTASSSVSSILSQPQETIYHPGIGGSLSNNNNNSSSEEKGSSKDEEKEESSENSESSANSITTGYLALLAAIVLPALS